MPAVDQAPVEAPAAADASAPLVALVAKAAVDPVGAPLGTLAGWRRLLWPCFAGV